VSAYLLVDQQGRVLLTLREFPPEAGCWSIVGGKLDFLEALEDGAVREAFEEVGLKIAIDSLLCVTDHLLPAEGQHWGSPAYLGRVFTGETRNCEPEKTRNAIEAYRRRSGLHSLRTEALGWARAAFFNEPEFLASDKCPGS
jgi:ADP-ribose pyrophosphatase YjhB (NUDIX family)